MAWRGRVGEWKPNVQRNETSLGAGAQQHESQDESGDER